MERQVAVELAGRERLRVRPGGDQRADERGGERPRAVVHRRRVCAQLRRDRRHRHAARRDRDGHRVLVAGALARELLHPVLELGA